MRDRVQCVVVSTINADNPEDVKFEDHWIEGSSPGEAQQIVEAFYADCQSIDVFTKDGERCQLSTGE